MKIIRHLSSLTAVTANGVVDNPSSSIGSSEFTRLGSVLTIGNFDGLHIGHQAIVKQVLDYAREHGLRSQLMFFEPQPREFFAPQDCPARLMSRRAKLEKLCSYPLDEVVCLRFDAKLSQLSAVDFVERLLVQGCRITHLIVGDDFHFGHDRSGDFALLQRMGKQHGFTVANTSSVCCEGKRVSSTWIRQTVWAGDFELVARLLGHPYELSGRVRYGAQLGRQLGFPTANLHLPTRRLPLQGIFFVEVEIARSGLWLSAVASVGYRPSVNNDNKVPKLEVYLLKVDNPNLYGQWLRVRFLKQWRHEEKFSDLAELQQAIAQDVTAAEHFFALQRK